MAHLGMPTAGGVGLDPDEVADGSEAAGTPGGQELVDVGPAVEAHGVAVGLEYSEHLGEGRIEPAVVIVVGNTAADAVAVTHEVGRVGQHEVDAVAGDAARFVHAVAVDEAAGGSGRVVIRHGSRFR